ncbi:MAG: DUF4446 family protein [Fimbriimonas ginsengisoli]|uniref:DUF4446 family protein n=1 Tax=Fimbriimonas ginsengisoli TaxID=1005039 RepID=A0A931LUI9_FIMGI|nr:DUF4446 family protein [Fimbriimonas ginsengisoli]MBI3722087.1 DUF4446 family protein [Fimbriimonas ginsengisoli]
MGAEKDWGGTLPQALMVAVPVLAVLVIYLWIRLERLRAPWQALLRAPGGQNLEAVLLEHLRERLKLESHVQNLDIRLTDLEAGMIGAKRHFGLVRYDAFDDVGGSQSFSLAMCDDRGDGAVLTSLIGRTDCRVYCKSLEAGRSERALSKEEEEALRAARDAGALASSPG